MVKNDTRTEMYDDVIFSDKKFHLLVGPNRKPEIRSEGLYTRVFHEEIEMKYFVEDGCVLQVGEEIIHARAGDIVVINPYEFHANLALGEKAGRYHYFIVGLDFFEDTGIGAINLRDMLLKKQNRFCHLFREQKEMEYLLLKIVEEMERREEGYQTAVGGLMLTLFTLLRRMGMQQTVQSIDGMGIRHYHTVEPALRKIRDEYARKLTLEELAELCNVSKCYFSRIFRTVTGMTVVQYITEYRFNIADIMLHYSKQSIADIARSCGFENESYFCRYYKKKRGISPYQSRMKG